MNTSFPYHTQNLSPGSPYLTWYQGGSDFSQYQREEFTFIRNFQDDSYTLQNQEPDTLGNLYCMIWETGIHSNDYSSTNELGAAISSTDCSSNASKWFLIPVSIENDTGLIHWQIMNKASNTCMYPAGSGNSFLFGFTDCGSVTDMNTFIVVSYPSQPST